MTDTALRLDASGRFSPEPKAPALTPLDWGLYAGVVFFWGTSWIALHLQLGRIAPSVSLTWRFSLAALIMLVFSLAKRVPLRFPARLHVRFAGLGAAIFSLNFLLFYYAGLTTPSGLLAVVFSSAAAVNMALNALVFRERPSARMLLAAVFGIIGVGLLFAPQMLGTGMAGSGVTGLALCVGGTLCFCLGSLLMRTINAAGVPTAASTTWGMVYGAALLAAISLVQGDRFAIEPTPAYLGSLVWLAVCSSVLAFACYLTLLSRIGVERASYSTVLYPVVALAVSTVFEGYVWTPLAILGLALALAGNALALSRGR